jgi:hypothetical protein
MQTVCLMVGYPPRPCAPVRANNLLAGFGGGGGKLRTCDLVYRALGYFAVCFDLCAHNPHIECARHPTFTHHPSRPLTSPRPPAILWGMNDRADTLLEELRDTPPAAPHYPYQEGKAIQKIRYTHDAMIDQIVMNPSISQNELAAVFGYTPAWVSLVMSSDAWKERLAARKAELVDPTIVASLNERFEAMVRRSLDVLNEKLAQPASAIPDNLALRAAELGAKALGLGGNAPPPPVPAGRLEQLAERLVGFLPQPRIYDAIPLEISHD